MSTCIRPELDELGRSFGETVWVAQLDSGAVLGVAWEWVEAVPGVPALRDPNGFISNVRLLALDGADASELECIVELNRIAHTVAWQDVVSQAIVSARSGGAVSVDADALHWPGVLCQVDVVPGLSKVVPSLAHAAPANVTMRPRALVA